VYVNDAFVRVSGFGREELDGNAHGVVRHPDMSRATFEDMWTTIRGGLPWSSLVQNGRKDGEHCWVRSSASPIGPDATVVGVLTVRTEASNEEKHAHETLYQRINAGARHLNVHCGCVVGVHGLVELGQDIQQASRDNQPVNLTRTGYILLHTLLKAAPRIVSRETLEQAVWGEDRPDSDALRTHIHALRQAIDKPFAYPMLLTVPGSGYRLALPDAP